MVLSGVCVPLHTGAGILSAVETFSALEIRQYGKMGRSTYCELTFWHFNDNRTMWGDNICDNYPRDAMLWICFHGTPRSLHNAHLTSIGHCHGSVRSNENLKRAICLPELHLELKLRAIVVPLNAEKRGLLSPSGCKSHTTKLTQGTLFRSTF